MVVKYVRALALAAGVVAVALSVAGIVMAASIPGYLRVFIHGNLMSNAAVGVAMGVSGAAIAWARPGNAVGWLLIAESWLGGALPVFTDPYGKLALQGQDLPAANWWAWIGSWSWPVAFLMAPTVVLTLWPTGRATGRSRLLVVISSLAIAALAVSYALDAHAMSADLRALGQPVMWPEVTMFAPVVFPLVIGCVLVSVVAAAVRLAHSVSPEREQLGWYLTVNVLLFVTAFMFSAEICSLVQALLLLTLGWSLLWYGIADLRLVLRRTLVYTLLTVAVALLYASVTGVLAARGTTGPAPDLAAAAIVAVGLLPARDLLQRGVDRVVYGERRDPVEAVARVGEGLSRQADSLLQAVAASVATAMRSPSVRIEDAAGTVVASHGTGAPGGHVQTLDHLGTGQGRLVVVPRPPGDRLDNADLRVLRTLAPHIALAVRAHALAVELARSRCQVLAAALAERERIRADLHDGMGPALSGLALGLQRAETLLESGPEAARQIVARTRQETRRVATEVRRIIEDLRPDILDQQGLPAALREHARLIEAGGLLSVDMHIDLPVLPPAIELAVYRITLEAITNVIRHADARHCTIRLSLADQAVSLTVSDDGHGMTPNDRTPDDTRVGLHSIRQRTTALGGTTRIDTTARGTCLHVQLPLSEAT